jgi:hypothetical protein
MSRRTFWSSSGGPYPLVVRVVPLVRKHHEAVVSFGADDAPHALCRLPHRVERQKVRLRPGAYTAYSAQLEPFLTQKHTLNTPNTPCHPPKHPRNNP